MLEIENSRIVSIEAVEINRRIPLPVVMALVPAGFPSPADDYIEKNIDLNEWMIDNEIATYIVRVSGSSMNDEIHSGDRLIVDRSLEQKNKDVVIAIINGEMTVKRFVIRGQRIFLVAENSHYSEIEVMGEAELIIWGVVKHCIHSFR
ncbi:MAG: LexA family protein [Pyrinomonadaceae bacterium]